MKPDSALHLTELAEALESRGWDVTVGDELRGRLEDALGVWSIAIDRAGRLRFSSTRPTSAPQSRRLQRTHRRYRLLLEAHSVLTVATQLTSADELPAILDQLSRFAKGSDL